jgi:hypothetical protein
VNPIERPKPGMTLRLDMDMDWAGWNDLINGYFD